MKNLDQPKYTLEEIFERKKANDSVKRLQGEFHEKLIAALEKNNCMWSSNFHDRGITYYCGDNKGKSFIRLNINSEFLAAYFYTGDKSINGIVKGNWNGKNDMKGSAPFPIRNESDMEKAISYSLEAYKIKDDGDNKDFSKDEENKAYRSKILKTPIAMNISTEPLNQILFGPPGTGKTYNSIDLAVKIATGISLDHKSNKSEFDRLRSEGIIEFVTFHQNYTYEDFMVGIRPDIENALLRFAPYKGIFYQLCKRARDNYEASKLSEKLQSFEELLDEFILSKISPEQPLEMKTIRGRPFWLTDYTDKTIYLRKSTGSELHTLSITTLIDLAEGRKEMVSGLSAYYHPIIEVLRSNRRSIGIKEERKNFVLVIDEINRANISKVFGELITLLEDDKRLDRDNELRITLPNGELDFSIPPNLFLIGTMNTADKSIALIDIALRRRFEFVGYYPDYTKLESEAAKLLEQINSKIYNSKTSSDYLIGHAYFMNGSSIETTLKNKVIPLLMEYFSSKINLVSDIFKETDWSVSYNSKTYTWDIQAKAE